MSLLKKSFTIGNHRTSISLEPEFWYVLELKASEQDVSLSKLILKIRKLVEKIMSKDPRLENENNLLILKNVKMIIEKKDIWEYIS